MRDPRSAGRSRSPEATRAALRSGGGDSRRGPLAPAFPSLKATLQTQKRWKRSRCRAPSVLAAAVAPDGPGRARAPQGRLLGPRRRRPALPPAPALGPRHLSRVTLPVRFHRESFPKPVSTALSSSASVPTSSSQMSAAAKCHRHLPHLVTTALRPVLSSC